MGGQTKRKLNAILKLSNPFGQGFRVDVTKHFSFHFGSMTSRRFKMAAPKCRLHNLPFSQLLTSPCCTLCHWSLIERRSSLLVICFSQHNLSGFYDPCPGEEKMLRIHYEFRDALHEVTVADEEPVKIPKQCNDPNS